MFSVIIPVYNGEKYIDKAVESVFAQTFTDWEMIIVNDGSIDNTQKILKKFESDSRIKIINQENAGVSVARNNGILSSKGEYVVFLDADDEWHTNHLEVMNNLINKYPDAGLYATFTRTELVDGNIIEDCLFFKDKTTDDFYTEDFFEVYYKDRTAKMFTVITTCIARNALKVSGLFPVGCKIGEDLELSLRVAAYYPVVLSKIPTATYKKVHSTATKDVSFDPDWSFFDTVNELYEDRRIPKSKKDNIRKIMQWFIMRRARHYVIEGKKKEAYLAYKNIGNEPKLKKDKFITFILLLMPVFAVRKVFEIRWRSNA